MKPVIRFCQLTENGDDLEGVIKLTFCSRLYVFSSLRWRHLRAACLFLTRLTSRFSSSAGDNSLSANFALRPGLFFDKGRNFGIEVLWKCLLLF